MSKQSLLLVDGDARSLRVLEVSLRKAGFTVTTAINGGDALEKLALSPPELVISETKLDDMDGFELCKRIKANPLWAEIPFVFLTANTGIEHKVKGLELGVDDYLTKPIYIKEVVTRLQILLQKRQRTRIEERQDGRTRFVGRLSDMAVVDLIQTIEISRKSGVIQFTGEAGRQAAIYFRDGKVVDAEAGPLQGEDAVYRLLTWNDGAFEVVFRTVRRRDVITTPSQGLLMEGMRRLDEWTRLCEQLPSLDTRFEVDTRELTQRLGDIPDENNTILKLMDGRRTLNEVIDAGSVGDLECLQAVSRLYFEGLLIEAGDPRTDVERRVVSATARTEDSSQWIVPATVFDETPVEAERIVVGGGRGSGPLPIPRVIAVPQPTGREGSGPRTIPPPPPPGRRGAGSNPIPIARTDAGSGRISAVAAVTESGRIAAPPAEPAAPAAPALASVPPLPEAPPMPPLAAAKARTSPPPPPAVAPPATLPDPGAEERMRSPSGSIEVGVLKGEFRPSGLHKIDQAVMAAQLIAPGMFDDDELPSLPPLAPPASGTAPTEPMPAVAAALHAADAFADEPSYVFEADMGSVPDEYLEEDEAPRPSPAPTGIAAGPGVVAADGEVRPARSEGSSPRILASHGADQAQVSGELPLRGSEWPEKETTARELVTIKPRRITREIPAVVPSAELLAEAEAADAAEAASRATAGRTSAAMTSTSIPVSTDGAPPKPSAGPPLAATTTAVERPKPASRPPTRAGSGTSRSMHARGPEGVGGLPWIAGAIGLALMAAAYMRCRHAAEQPVVATGDAAMEPIAVATPDAAPIAQGPVDAAVVALAPVDAAVVALAPVDAAPAPAVDAHRVIDAPTAPGYKELRDKAQAALDDNDPTTALELAEKSLALSKSARTILIKAEALRRLDRVDDAIATVDLAIARDPAYAPAWETKGRILWGVRRLDEARAAYEKYLELKPTGSTADRIRSLLGK